ncbi:MAG: hypothetical protein AAGC68_05720, partial [Verrucomicrobiota bacterium]
NETTITDIRIPFWRLAGIILKFMLASIPAMFVLHLIYFTLAIGLFALTFGTFAIPEMLEHLDSTSEALETLDEPVEEKL